MEVEMESSNNGCQYDMPVELLFEIFIYLPVKSLIRFSCVCKSWLHMIRNDPQFAIRHYLFRTTKPCRLMDNVDYVVDYFGNVRRGGKSITSEDVFKLSMYSLTENKTFRFEKKIEFGPGLGVSVSNFCHGIMCAFLSSSTFEPNIMLCNPTIREVVPIPISTNIRIHGKPIFGFGFDPINNDYKIIAIHRSGVLSKDAHWLVDVYSVRDSSWHSLPVITPLEQFSSLGGKPALNANGRILNWLGFHENSGNNMLVSFDIVDEVFIMTTLPQCRHLNCWHHFSLLPSSHYQACYYCSPSYSSPIEENEFNGVDIWVLHDNRDEGDNLWTKQLSFEYPDVDMVVLILDVWMNDRELFVCLSESYGYLDVVFHYDICTRELKRTGRLGNLNNPDGYSESLVSIKGLMLPPPQGVARGGDGDGNEDENTKQKDNGDGCVCFIREIGKRNKDVHWSYSFKLV